MLIFNTEVVLIFCSVPQTKEPTDKSAELADFIM